jgi:hypothetical protein
MSEHPDPPTSEFRRIEAGLGVPSTEASKHPSVTISPPPHRIDVPLGADATVHLPHGFWPWSMSIGLSPEGVVEVIQSHVTDTGDLSFTLRAVSVGEVVVQAHDYVDAEKYRGGPIPRIPNRAWSLLVAVI